MQQPIRRTAIAFLLTAAGALAGAGLARAQAPASPAAAATAAATAADGEVRKIDKTQAKLTLKHGPIASLDMPPMTMVFKVADPKLLDGLKDGDKVRFTAERIGGAITVTGVEVVVR